MEVEEWGGKAVRSSCAVQGERKGRDEGENTDGSGAEMEEGCARACARGRVHVCARDQTLRSDPN